MSRKVGRNNSLSEWTKSDWGYVGRGSRYLPKSVRDSLSKKERRETNRKKAKANREGKKKASYSKKISRLVKKSNKSKKIAVKANRKLWEKSVKRALKSHKGKRSARMYQLATRFYKRDGGKYI